MNETNDTLQSDHTVPDGEKSKARKRDTRTEMDSTDDRDFRAGFGVWSDERADRVRKARERRKRKSRRRVGRLSGDREGSTRRHGGPF